MQEEVNEKVIAVSIETTKLTAEILQKALNNLVVQMKGHIGQPVQHKGKQTLLKHQQTNSCK